MRAIFWLIGIVPLWGFLVPGCAIAADGQTPLARVELIKVAPKPGLAGLPASAPRPVLYYLDKARMPSCGLLPAIPGASAITPIFETEPYQEFPYCLEITDGAVFQSSGTTGFVFKYRQRDTREDSSTAYFFVQQAADGLVPLEKLNDETTPENKSIQYMAAWAKSRLVSLENEKESYLTSASDSIVTDSAFLNVSRNKAVGSCRVAVDLVSKQSSFEPVTSGCKAVLASTSWVSTKATYFIVLTETDGDRTKGQIFVIQGSTVREESELEEKLAAEISSRKILNVKESLRKLVQSN
jgi:hypothetical protein